MKGRRTVILVENAFLVVAGMKKLLAEVPGLSIEKVFDGSEKNISEKIKSTKPDIVFVNPIAAADQLHSLVNDISNNDCQLIGLLLPDTPVNIKSLFKNHLLLTDSKYDLLENLKSIIGKLPAKEYSKQEGSVLSEREKTILKLVVSGSTAQDIAEKLFLSIHTVNTHRKNITNKLGIKTVSGLTVYALMNKIVDINQIDSK